MAKLESPPANAGNEVPPPSNASGLLSRMLNDLITIKTRSRVRSQRTKGGERVLCGAVISLKKKEKVRLDISRREERTVDRAWSVLCMYVCVCQSKTPCQA